MAWQGIVGKSLTADGFSVARRQHSNSWRRRGPDGSGVLLTFLSLRPHREQIRGRPKLGGLHKITMECFFAPALFATGERSTVGLLSLQHT
jgi:hypothetical protein